MKSVGPFAGTLLSASLFSQTSSRPKRRRVGTPFELARVGSGWIHWLYQACTPGQYCCSSQARPTVSELPLPGFISVVAVAIGVHVLPKSAET